LCTWIASAFASGLRRARKRSSEEWKSSPFRDEARLRVRVGHLGEGGPASDARPRSPQLSHPTGLRSRLVSSGRDPSLKAHAEKELKALWVGAGAARPGGAAAAGDRGPAESGTRREPGCRSTGRRLGTASPGSPLPDQWYPAPPRGCGWRCGGSAAPEGRAPQTNKRTEEFHGRLLEVVHPFEDRDVLLEILLAVVSGV